MPRYLPAVAFLALAACSAEPAQPSDRFPGLASGEPVASTEQALGPCDPTGAVCGDDQTPGTCIYCAVTTGWGATLYNACLGSSACMAYSMCEGACAGPQANWDACRAQCQSTYPSGWTQYNALLHRVGCSCQVSCGALGETCP